MDDGNIEDIPDFDMETKLQELSSYADEDTLQNVLNKFPERYAMGVTAPILHLSVDKDTIIKNIIHDYCILSCLEIFFQFPNFFSFFFFLFYHVSNHYNCHMVTCFIFRTFIFADKLDLDFANYFNNNNNNSILVV